VMARRTPKHGWSIAALPVDAMKNKLTIGVFSEMLSECNGTAEAVRRLVIGLGNAGHDVHVFAPGNGVAGKQNVTFHKAGFLINFRMSREPEFYLSIPLIRYFFNNYGYYKELDAVHVATPMTVGALGLDIAKLHGIAKIITHHSPLQYYAGDYFPVIGKAFGFYAWKYERLIYNRFHVRHVPTLSKKQLILQYKIKEPIFALTNGILDEYFFKTPDARTEVLEHYKIPLDKKIMLYAGRQGPEKNIESILRALRAVRSKNIDAHLLCAGGGPHIPVLKQYAKELGIEENITFTGWIKHGWQRKVYDSADVSLLYNDIEAQGLVLLEAMAQGTPCIGKDSYGIKDVIVHGKTGYLANDEHEFARQIARVLSDSTLQKELGINALAEVTRTHKMSNVIPVWEKVYRHMINVAFPEDYDKLPAEKVVEHWRAFCAKEPMLKF
jgi:1,2-diacylglycerol 3-alpha-glucosyltransferase